MTCTDHHYACDCREAEWAEKLAAMTKERDEAKFSATMNLNERKILLQENRDLRTQLGEMEREMYRRYDESQAREKILREALEKCNGYTAIDENEWAVTVRLPMGERMRLIHTICIEALMQSTAAQLNEVSEHLAAIKETNN